MRIVKKTMVVLMTICLSVVLFLNTTTLHAENKNSTNLNREYIEVVVPAEWIPVDPNTREVLGHLGTIKTNPSMFPRKEVAENINGIYNITYMGTPKPTENTWTANNFMYVGNVLYRNKFHRVVANGVGQNNPNFKYKNSAVVKLEYGDHVVENYVDGLHGMTNTPYQEGKTLKLYLATVESSLSTPVFNDTEINAYTHYSDDHLLNMIYDNIEKVTYLQLNPPAFLTTDDKNEREVLDVVWVFDLEKDEFLSNEGGKYINFREESFSLLKSGEYEVVLPLYYEEPIPSALSAPEIFSRNRYTISDSIHFSLNLKSLESNVVVKHVDEEGNELTDSVTLTGEYGMEWDSIVKEIFGYKLKFAPEVTSGTFTEEDQEVVYVYEKLLSAPVTVKYVDEEGNELTDSVTLTGEYGMEWDSIVKEIFGYKLKFAPEVTSGTFTEEDQEVVYVYEKLLSAPVTVKHVDEEGNELTDSVILTGEYGMEWDSIAKEIFGYKLKFAPEVTSGTFTEEDQEVVYVYEKLLSAPVTVKYVDEEGNELSDSVILTGEYGTEWNSEKKKIANYEIFKTPTVEKGIFTEEEVELIYVYKKIVDKDKGPSIPVKPTTPSTGIANSINYFFILMLSSTIVIVIKKRYVSKAK